MRTTIEIADETRARLLELAARRGEKGFSTIVQEALDDYFRSEETRRARTKRALAALGSLDPQEADRLEDEVRELRSSWR
jgi:predicted transcriptional regulator